MSDNVESALKKIDQMPDDLDDRLLFCNSEPQWERDAERQRLRDQVVEAAKAYRIAVKTHVDYANEVIKQPIEEIEDNDPIWEAQLGAQCSAEYALSNAVDALLQFEQEQSAKKS